MLMLRKLLIQNFRAFNRLSVSGLERINLIAGRNNSGKTAFLEAIHLLSHPSDCEITRIVNEQRGLTNSDPMNVGRWLFVNAENSRTITMTVNETGGRERTLKIELVDGTT